MAYRKNRTPSEVNAGSMADIAFLLLIFFLVTTQIATNKGLLMQLPPPKQEQEDVPLPERNLLKIQLNSLDKLMVEQEIVDDVSEIEGLVYDFVLNFGNPDDKKRGSDKVTDNQTFQSLPPRMQNYIRSKLGDSESSDAPSRAIVSLKTDRGSSYEMFIAVMDQINAAYYSIYGERVGLTAEEYRKLNRNDPRQLQLYERGKRGINKAISLAEPSSQGGS
ncbi:biopolymer transport protein ExbD [Roseivirga pacifica]|uniref:Biopolymer transport protein ExbD n=1 Tax=Roseivirga pacifica TaxID=1267423 RepID=A0A1I0RMW6_9BACT|nr:biopolymer transporter ExbD [Roseivirga pacifica]MCO6358321.1 biopolymer transporter ExbD [Roseivirga pacifica]MCO6366215.1 biopolymer transporter ExbD [Roseivirga pacifica]MCO6369234.1 biopolymer transporter ExbD [Roseivirga pacifica]MCO6374052.1 biopolymer transporter ExbD [Roseivirga pacifica]MCO6378428.1 biopolymer transporter ExbD [Roseivirga pacifica]